MPNEDLRRLVPVGWSHGLAGGMGGMGCMAQDWTFKMDLLIPMQNGQSCSPKMALKLL